jgi:hypothetical protein
MIWSVSMFGKGRGTAVEVRMLIGIIGVIGWIGSRR